MTMFKKITATLLALTLVVCCSVSCDLINKPTGGLQLDDSYVAEIRISYESDNAELNAAISGIKDSSATLSVDGETLKLERHTVLEGSSVSESFVFINEWLCHQLTVSVDKYTVSERERALVNEENREYIESELGIGANIDLNDFIFQDVVNNENGYSYICTGMTEATMESLAAIVAKSFAPFGGTVAVKDGSLEQHFVEVRMVRSRLSCDLTVAIDGVSYDVTMHIDYEYDYDATPEIALPDGFGEYEEVSCSEIFN